MNDLSTGIARLRSGRPTQFVRRPRANMMLIPIGLSLLACCMWLVRDGEVSTVERSVFAAMNGLPDSLQAPVWVFQLFGSLVFVALVALLALGLARTRLGFALLVGIPLKLAFEWWGVKALVERERPFLSIPDAVIREANSSPLGFPSGHAIFAFILAGCLTPYVGKRSAIVLYSLAAMNGVARVYLGAHNPLDEVAGGALGITIAAGINLAFRTPSRQPAPSRR